ncbi:hypothetical protein ACIGO7_35520 [Streptomyces virginiae]|uniref:hypothetical protein n=1 Tax=Streptomyces virginiae TaxID=1961 RepID=UPI00344D8F36
MTEQPYTDGDLRDEAARQLASLVDDHDFMGIGEQMADSEIESLLPPAEADGAEGTCWGDLDRAQFADAQRKIDDLLTSAVDLSEWAVNLGADSLQASEQQLNIGDGRARIHFAFAPDMSEADRRDFVAMIAAAVITGG